MIIKIDLNLKLMQMIMFLGNAKIISIDLFIHTFKKYLCCINLPFKNKTHFL